MKKLDVLVKRVEQFERLAIYGDRKSFLKRLAQENMSKEPNYSAMPPTEPNASFDPNAPAPAPKPATVKETVINEYPSIAPQVQKMLNQLLVPPRYNLQIKEDGKLGPETSKALNIFKSKFNKPASVAAITEEFNKLKSPSTAVTNSYIQTPIGNLSNVGNTKSNANQSAGK